MISVFFVVGGGGGSQCYSETTTLCGAKRNEISWAGRVEDK